MLTELQQNSHNFLKERPSIASKQVEPLVLLQLALEEVHELIEAVGEGDRKNIVGELTDVFNYLAQFAFMAEIDEREITDYSRWVYEVRNYQKYPPEDDGVVSSQNQRALWEMRQKYGVGNDTY